MGGRLARVLLEQGFAVRCVVREPRKLSDRPWSDHPNLEIVKGDLSNHQRLVGYMQGCIATYYLVHSMVVSGDEYAQKDRRLAQAFADAAAEAKLPRIIYLGGLGEMGDGLSEHLRSRREVETLLESTGVPVTCLRAAMIIGSGSASFEILRYLVERLPVMITPSWVKTECQPVAIADVLHWLAECLRTPSTVGQTLEIGGPDVMAYRDLMRVMAEELELPRRIILPIPLLTPRLSSGWISLVTPVSYRYAKPLANGLKNRVVVTNNDAQEWMPHNALTVRQAISRSLVRTKDSNVETRWSAAGPIPGDPDWAGGLVYKDERKISINAPANKVFAAVCRVGGGHGWYAADVLWRIRGWMDQMVGGPGLRRGRRDPEQVEFGEALDFWRVVGLERDRSLLLLAEMKLPGVAQLAFDLAPQSSGQANPDSKVTQLTMTARFRPKGLLGIAYWYAVLPLHGFVFKGMLRGIKRAAESKRAESKPTGPGSGDTPPETTPENIDAREPRKTSDTL